MKHDPPVPYLRNRELRPGMLWPANMRRIVLAIEYNGSAFHGFQVQAQGTVTVQSVLQRALSYVADESITLVCAGRTDAGVHATKQIVHFDTIASRPSAAWIKGVNTRLPKDVRVLWAREADSRFHSRFGAVSRTYSYVIFNTDVHSALFRHLVTCINGPVNVDDMRQAAQCLLGKHDFSSFRAAHCQAHHPVRTVSSVSVESRGALIKVQITANAFLYHMVRNIVGSLLEVGSGKHSVPWFKQVLEARDRTQASVKAPADGLYFIGVDFGENYPWPEFVPRQPLIWPF